MKVNNDIALYSAAAVLLDYEPDTGHFRWKVRENSPSFNGRFAGKVAGTLKEKERGGNYIEISLNFDGEKRFVNARRLAYFIIFGKMAEGEVGNKNGNALDNSKDNIVEATRSERAKWDKIRADNTSGFVGLHYNKAKDRHVVKYKENGKTVFLGEFKNKQDAIDVLLPARKAAGFLHTVKE